MKALIFDLDGTLVDSVYPHTLAWQQTLNEIDLRVPAWEIHRRIGISGKLLVRLLARARHRSIDEGTIAHLEQRHNVLFREYAALQRPLPGALDLLEFLQENSVAHGIATTGKRSEIEVSLKALKIGPDRIVVDGSSIESAKPEPDLFVECQRQLGIPKPECLVVGDSVWDVHAARRAGILAVGVTTGGFAEQELYNAGAMRVYRDAATLLTAIDETGLSLG